MRRSKKPADSSAADRENPSVSSRLLPEVFVDLDTVRSPTVLDLGPGDPSTVAYLNQYNAHVYFLDIGDEPELLDAPGDITPDDALVLLDRLLHIPPGTMFDILLFWDYLHLLNTPLLDALSTYLQPHVHAAARGYGFGTMRAPTEPALQRFGIQSADTLVLRQPTTGPALHSHSQNQLAEHFLCMNIAKATLLREGKLELLFTAP